MERQDYSIEESSGELSSPITLQFRNNQNPFTVMLSPVTVFTAEGMGLGFFINYMTIDASSRAATGTRIAVFLSSLNELAQISSDPPDPDFSDTPITITVPADRITFEIPPFFSINDDNIDEYEQSFAVVAEIGPDVPENISCFQTAVGETECFGRRGATEIRITDNDRKMSNYLNVLSVEQYLSSVVIHLTAMIIGFTTRTVCVPENNTDPGFDLWYLPIELATVRAAEREHRMILRLQEASGLAIVEPIGVVVDQFYDATFGSRHNIGGPIEVFFILDVLEDTIPPLTAFIRRPENEECFTIRILPVDVDGRRELFACNEDDSGEDNYFCQHTICIEDDDGRCIYMMLCLCLHVLHHCPIL